VAASDYKGPRDMQVPPGCNPNGLDMIHGPKAKNNGAGPRQILDAHLIQRFPMISDELDVVSVPLERLSPYLSMESKNTPIGFCMRLGH
jgi:hypothetical protein